MDTWSAFVPAGFIPDFNYVSPFIQSIPMESVNERREEFMQKELRAAKRPKGIKTADIKRMKRTGASDQLIAEQFDCTIQTVRYHLAKKRKDSGTVRVKHNMTAEPVKNLHFEVELFGTTIKLDETPVSIEKVGNKLVIK